MRDDGAVTLSGRSFPPTKSRKLASRSCEACYTSLQERFSLACLYTEVWNLAPLALAIAVNDETNDVVAVVCAAETENPLNVNLFSL